MSAFDEHADVLIIGAGASAGIAAARLAQSGVSVICLEAGDWPDRDGFRGTEPDWELTGLKQWSPDPNVRQGPGDYPIDVSGSDISILNFNGVGGGTVLFNAVWIRLLPSNFRTHSLDGVGDDWPLEYADLLPFYERVDREIGVSGLGGNPAYPPGADPPLPPLPLGRAGMAVARAMHELGWHWWPETNAILSAPFAGRHNCVQRGTCMQGCQEGAKSSIDLTHWAKMDSHVRLVTGAGVRRIVVDRHGRACGAEWIDRDGREHFQSADVVLCAANGIGTPRILLNSACDAFPDGLANRSGMLGRRLMLHPTHLVAGAFDQVLDTWQGHFGSSLHSLQFYESDPERDFVRGAKWSLHPIGGPLVTALTWTGPDQFGPGHHRSMRETFGRSIAWTVMAEDLPEDANRVELSADLTDGYGVPAARVVYRTSENSRRILEFNTARAEQALRAAGAVRTQISDLGRNAHLLGTARMGYDPATSVVDPSCISHDVPNLGIIDGSVFVTAGASNPTATICALALRAAERLLEIRAQIPVPGRPVTIGLGPGVQASAKPARPEPADPTITHEQRKHFAALGDALIPGDETMPSATTAGIGGDLLDRLLESRPDLAESLSLALAEPTAEAGARLGALMTSDPGMFQQLVVAIAGAYYLSPKVRSLIGYPGQLAKPVVVEDFPTYIAEGLLDHLTEQDEPTGSRVGQLAQ